MKNRNAILALIAAGSLWGVTVGLSKLSLRWLDPSWLTAMRFLVAAPVLAVFGRRALREAFTPRVLGSGALGYGVVLLLQNAGIEHTSVSHAAIIVGVLPVVVALVAAGLGTGGTSPLTWLGYAVALVGIMLVAKGGGGGATVSGDMLVFGSVVMSGIFIAVQPRLLKGRDAAAVTAVQFAAAAGIVAAGCAAQRRASPRTHGVRAGGRVRGVGACRHGPVVLAVRLRPGARRGRTGGRVREPRAARRRAGGLGGILRPGGTGADSSEPSPSCLESWSACCRI